MSKVNKINTPLDNELSRIKELFKQFIASQSNPVSIWKAPNGLKIKLPLKEQIDVLHQSICLDANKAACADFCCKTIEDLLGNKFNNISPGKNYEHLFTVFIKNKYSLRDYQTTKILHDGSAYCSIENWFGIIDNDELLYFCIVSKDITNCKMIEQSFAQQLLEMDQILDSMLTGFILINNNGKLIRANPAYCKMTGYSEKELLNMKINDLEVGICSNRNAQSMEKIGNYSSARFEAKHKHKDGYLLDVDINIVFVKYNGNSMIAAFTDDITQNKIAEKKLLQEKNRAQNYLNIAGVIILVLDKDGKVILINQKGCEILGYDQNKIIGKNWFNSFLPEKNRKEVRNVINKIINNVVGPYKYYENPVLTKNGDEKLIAWYNTLLQEDDGKIIGILSSGEDITLRKKYENQLKTHRENLKNLIRERTKELEESNRKLKEHSSELETFNKAMLDREMRIIEMKEEVNALCTKFGLEIKYPPVWDK